MKMCLWNRHLCICKPCSSRCGNSAHDLGLQCIYAAVLLTSFHCIPSISLVAQLHSSTCQVQHLSDSVFIQLEQPLQSVPTLVVPETSGHLCNDMVFFFSVVQCLGATARSADDILQLLSQFPPTTCVVSHRVRQGL